MLDLMKLLENWPASRSFLTPCLNCDWQVARGGSRSKLSEKIYSNQRKQAVINFLNVPATFSIGSEIVAVNGHWKIEPKIFGPTGDLI
jgi:hypothetical protein